MFWQFDDGKISVSTGSFSYWLETPALRRRLELALSESLLNDLLVDGFEIGINLSELDSWLKTGLGLKKRLPGKLAYICPQVAERVLALKSNTIHLPPLTKLPRTKVKAFGGKLKKVFEHTGISDFTVHPDEMASGAWAKFLDALPDELRLSVENMDRHKTNYQSLDELAELFKIHPRLMLTFDICHWMELGHSSHASDLLAFLLEHSHRISKVHLSAPRSAHQLYLSARNLETSHYLISGSGITISEAFFQSLPRGIPWVIEGVIPPFGYRLLKTEIEQFRELSFATATRKKVVGS